MVVDISLSERDLGIIEHVMGSGCVGLTGYQEARSDLVDEATTRLVGLGYLDFVRHPISHEPGNGVGMLRVTGRGRDAYGEAKAA